MTNSVLCLFVFRTRFFILTIASSSALTLCLGFTGCILAVGPEGGEWFPKARASGFHRLRGLVPCYALLRRCHTRPGLLGSRELLAKGGGPAHTRTTPTHISRPNSTHEIWRTLSDSLKNVVDSKHLVSSRIHFLKNPNYSRSRYQNLKLKSW